MIQTAEGALQETHNILQRMRELATQASNDTNVEVDRNEIQKEMNPLTSEINRIGNTTEFNTQKILNGGGEVKDIAMNTKQVGGAAGAFKGATDLTPAAATESTWDLGTITQTLAANAATSHSMTFNGVTINVTGLASAASGTVGSASIDAANKTVSVTLGTLTDGATAEHLATAIKTAFDAYKGDAGTTELNDFTMTRATADLEIEAGTTGSQYNNLGVTATGITGLATPASGNGTEAIAAGSKSAPVTTVTSSVKAVAAEWSSGALTQLTNGQSGTLSFGGVTLNISAETTPANPGVSNVNQVSANLKLDAGASAADQAQAIVDAFNAIKAEQPSNGSLANFTFERVGDGLKISGTTEDGAKNNSLRLTETGNVNVATDNVAPQTAGVTERRGEFQVQIDKAFEVEGATINIGGQFLNAGETFKAVSGTADSSKGEFSIGSNKEEQAISLAAAINASSLKDRFDAVVDGDKITLREKEGQATGVGISNGVVASNESVQGQYSFNVDNSVAVGGKYSVGGVNIEVTDDKNHKGLANGTAVMFSSDTTQQASNLANAIAANKTLSEEYTVSSSANRITLEQKTGQESASGATASTSTSKHTNFQASFQIGANTGQSMTIQIDDMRSQALNISGDKTGTVTAKNGAEASFVQTANVSNGTNNDSVEYSLDVSIP